MEETVAIVPLRSPGTGKTRLRRSVEGGSGLDREQRAALARGMLSDVLSALDASTVDRVVVAAAGAGARATAVALGCEVSADPPGARGLNDAIRASTARLPAAARVLVVAADLPCLTYRDVDALVGTDASVAIAPTRGGGTGGLLRDPGGVIGPAYGPGSASAHAHAARRAGHEPVVVRRDGFRFDVDTWDDLTALDAACVGTATRAVLGALAGVIPPAR